MFNFYLHIIKKRPCFVITANSPIVILPVLRLNKQIRQSSFSTYNSWEAVKLNAVPFVKYAFILLNIFVYCLIKVKAQAFVYV